MCGSPSIIFEDEHLLAVVKPPRLHTVKTSQGGPSVADWLIDKDNSLESVADRPGDAGLVQRLDYDTSGVLLAAKSSRVWHLLRSAVQTGAVQKTYVALLAGLAQDSMQTASYIGSPYRRGTKVRVYATEPRGSARALYGETFFKRISIDMYGNSLFEISASPARRHQIRVHSSHLGFPLVGDSLYGSTVSFSELYFENRTFFLHASSLRLQHPITDEKIEITAPFAEPQPRS